MLNAPAGDFDMAAIVDKLVELMRKHKIVTPGYFFLLLRALAYLEGLILVVTPDQNLMDLMRPYVQKMIKKGLNIRERLMNAFSDISEMDNIIRRTPGQLSRLIDKMSNDELFIGMEHKGLDELTSRLDKMTNRVVLAIIIGCLLLASSVVVLAKVPPLYNGMPLLGTIGFIISAVLGFVILFKIFRKGKF